MALDQEKRLEHLRTYAWSWFSFHADQRTKMFNYFVASSAFLVAGFASAVSNHLWQVALAIGGLGTLNGIFFWRLDARNEALVNYGKAALHNFEHAIFGEKWPPESAAAGGVPGAAGAVSAPVPSTPGSGPSAGGPPVPVVLAENKLVLGISLADKAADEIAVSKTGKASSKAADAKNKAAGPRLSVLLQL